MSRARETEESVTYSSFFKTRRINFVFLSLLLYLITGVIIETTLAKHLTVYFGFSAEEVGYFFLFPLAGYSIFTPVVNYLVKKYERKVIIFWGIVIYTLGLILVGPTLLFSIPK